MKFRAITLATALLVCLGPFLLAQDAQKAPAPDSTTADAQKAPAPDSNAPVATDSNASAASQDESSPPPAADNTSPAAQGPGTSDKQKSIKPGSKDDVSAIGNRNMGGKGLATGTRSTTKSAWASSTPCRSSRASSWCRTRW